MVFNSIELTQSATHVVENSIAGQNLIARWPIFGVELQALRNNNSQIIREVFGDVRVEALLDFVAQCLHAVCPEWGKQCDHLIDHTAQAPNITFIIVWFVIPNFRACVVRCSCLSSHKAMLSYLRDVEIPKLE